MTNENGGGNNKLGRKGQIAWGAIGGLTPYVVAGLNAVGYRMDFPIPTISPVFVLALLGSIGLGVMGSILLESHTPFAAWYHGGSFRIMLNFLFTETLSQLAHQVSH